MSLARLLQVLPWLGMVLVLAGRGELDHFVVDWHAWIILTAVGLAALLVVWSLLGGIVRAGEPLRLGDLFVHLTPLFILACIGTGDLGSERLASSRLLMPTVPEPALPADAATTDPLPPVRGYLHTSGTAPDVVSTPALPEAGEGVAGVDLLDCYDPDRFGTRVRVVGRLLPADQAPSELAELVPGWLLYRYVITCCTADARAVLIGVEAGAGSPTGPDGEAIPADAWVVVDGVLQPAGADGPPRLELRRVEAIPVPVDPYLQLD